jgi:hypothetical protein
MKRLIPLLLFLIVPTVFATPIEPGLVNSESPVLVYAGSWTTNDTFAYAIDGTVQQTMDGSVVFDIYGDGFTLFFLYAADGIDVDVCIEVDCVTISTAGTASRGRADFANLDSGLKQVVISPTAPDMVNSFYFDGLYIYPDAPPTPEPESTPVGIINQEFTYGGETLKGQYHFVLTAGDSVITILLSTLTLVSLAHLVLGIWKER